MVKYSTSRKKEEARLRTQAIEVCDYDMNEELSSTNNQESEECDLEALDGIADDELMEMKAMGGMVENSADPYASLGSVPISGYS